MLDNVGKLFERDNRLRLEAVIEQTRNLSKNMLGFKTDRSTTDATGRLAALATEGINDSQCTSCMSAIIALDVRFLFNTERWENIMRVLEDVKVPL